MNKAKSTNPIKSKSTMIRDPFFGQSEMESPEDYQYQTQHTTILNKSVNSSKNNPLDETFFDLSLIPGDQAIALV